MKRVVFYFKDTKRDPLTVWINVHNPRPIERSTKEEISVTGIIAQQIGDESQITLRLSELAWWRVTG